MAIYDAELAFQWVRRNIRHFGGDPHKITIAGASAGAGVASLRSPISFSRVNQSSFLDTLTERGPHLPVCYHQSSPLRLL